MQSKPTISPEPQWLNRLLSSLDSAGRKRVEAKIERVQLEAQQVLYRQDERITDIYFPENCVVGMLTVMKNGASIESATVGFEGASWISASFRSPAMPCQTMVVISGQASKVPANVIEQEIRDNGAFHNTVSHYAHVLLVQTLRSTACNGLHDMQQRCARWMLGTLDRIGVENFAITHEFLANLLGVQRPGVSLLVERLAAKGVLEIRRGNIRVSDRQQLEKVSCECYGIMKEQFTKATALKVE